MEVIKQKTTILTLLTYAFTSTMIILAVVSHFVAAKDIGGGNDELLSTVLLTIAGAMLILSSSLKGFILKFFTSQFNVDTPPMIYLDSYLSAHVITLAVREGGVIVAFVLSLLTNNNEWVIYGSAIGVLLTIIDLPSAEKIKDYLPGEIQQKLLQEKIES